jgi:AcrR family transcriptional regulator
MRDHGATGGGNSSEGNRRQKKAALLMALRQVFERLGYDGATLNLLAEASGLSKASLYHHFPGGKPEMAAALLRDSVAELERLAFSRLGSKRPPRDRLEQFVDGFQNYVRDGEGNCMLLVLSQGSAAATYGDTIARQYADWTNKLSKTCVDAGLKPKRAERAASDLLASLYGHLLTCHLLQDAGRFNRHMKRLKKRLPG